MRMQHDMDVFLQRYDMDLVVIGGGVTGVVSAIAASRLGVKTLLIHNRPVLGGVSSQECIANANGNHVVGASEHVNRNARETGIIEELRLEARYLAANGWSQHWSIVLLDFCEREENLTLLLNTEAYNVEMEGANIRSVTARTIGSGITVEAYAPLFIDCSGDSFLAFNAGAEYRMGREGRDEFGEELAPEKADTKTMGSSIIFKALDTGSPIAFKAPAWAYKIESDDDLPYRIHHNYRSGWWWLEYGGELDTIADNEEIYRTLLSVLYGIWDHVKNGGGHDADNYVIDWVSTITGKRESRRLMGDVILSQHDVVNHTEFPDAVAYGGWPIDIHPPEGVFGKSHPGSTPPFIFPGIYRIPYRCLYSRNVDNLLMAGRNISVTHVALGTTRVTAT
ncbi:MAG: FAD-dependent oxidoreductase, partial [bacterium]|nr:FAD-dependent oxidoreductase [bacterium]